MQQPSPKFPQADAGPSESLRPLTAEQAYLFRHALLRDAAYQLQPQSDRGRLHALALPLLEHQIGSRPTAEQLEPGNDTPTPRLACDPLANELAEHARLARGYVSGAEAAEAVYLHRAAAHAARTYQHNAACEMWQRLGTLLTGADRVEALRRAGMSAFTVGRADSADLLAAALTAADAMHNVRLMGIASNSLANVLRDNNRLEEAERHYARAIAAARETADPKREATAVGNRAMLYKMKGQLDDAERGFETALNIARELRDSRIELICLLNLSNLYRQLNRIDDASRALELATSLPQPDRAVEGRTLGFRALLAWQVGRRDQAEEFMARSLVIAREVGDRRRQGECIGHLAGLYGQTGRLPESLRQFEHALAIHREMGASRQEGYHLCDYSGVLLRSGDVPAAKAAWRQGAATLRELRDDFELQVKIDVMHEDCAAAGVPPLE